MPSVVCSWKGHVGGLGAGAPLEDRGCVLSPWGQPKGTWVMEMIYGRRGGWGPQPRLDPVQGASGRNLEAAMPRHLGAISSVCQDQCVSQMVLLCAQLSASCHHFHAHRELRPATWQQPHLLLFSSYEFVRFCT